MGGYRYDRAGDFVPENGDGIHAVHLVHHHIHGYQVESPCGYEFEGFHAIFSFGDPVPRLPKQAHQCSPNVSLIVDNQYSGQVGLPLLRMTCIWINETIRSTGPDWY